MSSSAPSKHRAGTAARAGVAGTLVAAFAFFDGVFLGAPIALFAASFRPLVVYAVAVVAIVFIVTACCRWCGPPLGRLLLRERRPRRGAAGDDAREQADAASGRLDPARLGPLVRARRSRRQPDSRFGLPHASSAASRWGNAGILLGAVAYAIPYAAMWTIVGLVVGGSLRAAF
jgi:hypothetical protein